jgi:hypothetical protein
VVSDNDLTLFAYRDGVLSRDRAFSYFGEGLHVLISQARVTPMVEPAPVTAFVRNSQGIFLVAASALTPENPTPAQIVYRPRPVLIHARQLSPEMIGTLSERFGFDGLVLAEDAPPAAMDRLALALRTADGGLIDDCEIEIRVTCQRSVDTVFITVRDNGGGVPDGHIERVFEPFFTTKEPGEGTGLGLSISYGIIGGIDGELTVRNHGEGAEFTIKLPCVAPKNVAEATISEENRG